MKRKKVLTLIATLTASTLAAITITNRILCKLATSDHYLDEDEGEYYDWRFGKIFYKKEAKWYTTPSRSYAGRCCFLCGMEIPDG